MMNAVILINDPVIVSLHKAINREFLCDMERIIGAKTTHEKKVAVFILSKFFNYKCIAVSYGIYPIYLDEHISEISKQYISDSSFRDCVMRILNECEQLNF